MKLLAPLGSCISLTLEILSFAPRCTQEHLAASATCATAWVLNQVHNKMTVKIGGSELLVAGKNLEMCAMRATRPLRGSHKVQVNGSFTNLGQRHMHRHQKRALATCLARIGKVSKDNHAISAGSLGALGYDDD